MSAKIKITHEGAWYYLAGQVRSKCEEICKATKLNQKEFSHPSSNKFWSQVKIDDCVQDCSRCEYRADKSCIEGSFLHCALLKHKLMKQHTIYGDIFKNSKFCELQFQPYTFTKINSGIRKGLNFSLIHFEALFCFLDYKDFDDFFNNLPDEHFNFFPLRNNGGKVTLFLKECFQLLKNESANRAFDNYSKLIPEYLSHFQFLNNTSWALYHFNYLVKGKREINSVLLQFIDINITNNIKIFNYRGSATDSQDGKTEIYLGNIDFENSTSDCLVVNMKLSSEDLLQPNFSRKYLQLRFWLSMSCPQHNEICLGKYIHLDEGNKLINGSFVIQKLNSIEIDEFIPAAYKTYSIEAFTAGIHPSIQWYLFDKNLNYSNTPSGKTTIPELTDWLINNSEAPSYEYYTDCDIFFASPIKSILKHIDLKGKNQDEVLKQENVYWKKYKSIEKANILLVEALQKNLSQFGINSIYYYPLIYPLSSPNQITDSSTHLKNEFSIIDICKFFVLYIPDVLKPSDFFSPTSAFLELGYAIAKRKTIIIICNNYRDRILPYMLQSKGANELDIYLSPSNKNLNSIVHVVNWISSLLPKILRR